MANFSEEAAAAYDWENGGIYVIERDDPVEGGPDGVSNRQGRELALRTRNLHGRVVDLKQETTDNAAELAEAIDTKTEAALRSSKEYTDAREAAILAAANAKDAVTLENAKAYADSVVTTGSAAALRSAKEYTDAREASVLAAADTKDAATLRTAKDYADTIVAALVDGSPEALNTLQELASALGGDPNFATTVMQLIGERATMAQVNAALEGKANSQHAHAVSDVPGVWHSGNFDPAQKMTINEGWDGNADAVGNLVSKPFGAANLPYGYHPFLSFGSEGYKAQFNASNNDLRFRSSAEDGSLRPWVQIYHSGNLGPATSASDGLIAVADKQKIDNLPFKMICGSVYSDGRIRKGSGFSAAVVGEYIRVTHSLGHANYIVTATAFAEGDYNYRDNAVTTMSQAPSYFELCVSKGTENIVERCTVDFMLVCM